MVLFYGMGGGLGHLVRIKTFIAQEGISAYRIVTANPLAVNLFSLEKLVLISPDDSGLANRIREEIQTQLIAASAFYIDAFPSGILGELADLSVNVPVRHLARRLKWDQYASKPIGFRLEQVYQLEPLEANHQRWLKQNADHISEFKLSYPEAQDSDLPNRKTERPLWLVVHSFHLDEVQQLLDLAKTEAELESEAPEIMVISDQIDAPELEGIEDFQAWNWFPVADRIYTGCGFNSVYQLAPFRSKHRAIPFHRKLDDQHWRFKEVF